MKIKHFLIIAVVVTFSTITFAQSVIIVPRKITYRRPKPFSEYKKSFTVSYPKVRNLNPALAKKIENSVSYEKAFKLNIKEEIDDVQWLEEASYKVDYNKKGILGVILTMSGSAAYPSVYDKSVVVNLRTGETIKPQDVFVKLNELAAKCRNLQQAEIKKAIIDIKKEYAEEEPPADLFQNAKFTLSDLNEFSINEKGITFRYDYGFPHVILALQPEGRYFFSWRELKPFIKRGGLLAKFVR
jgi:hypothetical protein